jgi:hypothetical protein
VSLTPRVIGYPGAIRTECLGEDLIKGCLNYSYSSIISFGILAYGPANGDLDVLFSSFDSSFGFFILVLSEGRSPGVVNLEADGDAKKLFL